MKYVYRPLLVILSILVSGSVILCLTYGKMAFDIMKGSLKLACKNENHKLSVPMNEIVKGNRVLIRQEDPLLRQFILSNEYLHPPSTRKYNLTHPYKDPSKGQSKWVLKYFRNKKNGIFVECGALDGETRSNTLFLEKELGWKGLLIEADPTNFKKLLHKQRRAWAVKACLAIKPFPHEVIFKKDFNMGKIYTGTQSKKDNANFIRVQCFPLYSLMSALNITTVDYFSLDVEGNELEVLKTIPFKSVFIKMLSVEYSHVRNGEDAMKKFMLKNSYQVVGTVINPFGFAHDYIFVHKSLIKTISKV